MAGERLIFIAVAIAIGSLSARVIDDGLELDAEIVRLGWALDNRPGDDPFPRPEYELQEAEARSAGRGMWRGAFVAPWEWRHR